MWEIDRVIGIVDAERRRLDRRHYAEAWGRCTNLDDPHDTGTGHLECVVLGPYPGLDQ